MWCYLQNNHMGMRRNYNSRVQPSLLSTLARARVCVAKFPLTLSSLFYFWNITFIKDGRLYSKLQRHMRSVTITLYAHTCEKWFKLWRPQASVTFASSVASGRHQCVPPIRTKQRVFGQLPNRQTRVRWNLNRPYSVSRPSRRLPLTRVDNALGRAHTIGYVLLQS